MSRGSKKDGRKKGGVLVKYDYEPHPIQAKAHAIWVDEMLYGGAAGGGKSRWARAEAFKTCMQIPGLRALFFRRTFPDLNRSVVEPLLQEIPTNVGKYNRSEHVWRFRNGSILELGHLQTAADLLKYQGAEYQLIVFEEMTHFTEYQVTYMMSRLRAGGAVKDAMEAIGLRTRMVGTANPGGPGHHFVKARYVDPAPPKTVFRMAADLENPNPGTRLYIPARATDNPSVDKDYINKLNALPEAQRRALRDGDWNVLDGVRFSAWREDLHVVEPDISPMDLVSYPRCVAVDWGFSDEFAALWLAKLPDGTILVYRELYAKELTNTQQAQAILDAEMEGERGPERPIPVIMDPSMWRRSQGGTAHSGDPDAPPVGSPAHDYQRILKQRPIKAYNQRIPGWSRIDELLALQENTGFPLLQVYETCRELIRTLPALARDKKNPNDISSSPKQEDHLADTLRYGAMYMAGKTKERRDVDSSANGPAIPPLTAGFSTMQW